MPPVFELPVQSGRVVILARRRPPKVPMHEACYFSEADVQYGTCCAVVGFEKIKGHPGTLAVVYFFVGAADKAASLQQSDDDLQVTVELFCHSPKILVGDHSFIYQRAEDPQQEGGRALRACEGSRRVGTFRADSSDVGCCLRTGLRRCVFEVRQVDGGVAAQLVPSSTTDDEDYLSV